MNFKKLGLEDTIILVISASKENQINGRTSIQKIVYFCVNTLNLENDFIPHFFGPYSSSVDVTLNNLISFGLLYETPISIKNGRRMYSYSLTQDGLKYSKKLMNNNKRVLKKIQKIVGIFEKLGKNRINLLAFAAKVHYMAQTQEKLTVDSAKEKAKSLGWDLNEREIILATDIAKKIIGN